MAKKKTTAPASVTDKPVATPAPTPAAPVARAPLSIYSFRLQAIILAVAGFIFYCNTFGNTWAYDDLLVILQNEYVQEGVSGIPKILTNDAFDSYTRQQNEESTQLTGGRYRPLSMVTFAMEQQLLGVNNQVDSSKQMTEADMKAAFKARQAKINSDMHFRHVVNVLLYILSVIVLLYFLHKIVFPRLPLAAFFTALIFIVHPLHTEVVANIKSRDEILSMLFLGLTLILAFSYTETKKRSELILACTCYLLALLSKEYGVMFIVLLPLTFYMFKSYNPRQSIQASLIYLVPFVIYLMMRFSSVKPAAESTAGDIMNNPYAYATVGEKMATEVAVLLNYIKLLLVPYPLTSDYTYNQVPYVNFGNIRFWLSLIVHGGLLYYMVQLLRKRHVMGYAIAFYFIFLVLVCNIFVNIGAPMGERLVYHSSLGFAMVLGYLLAQAYGKIKPAVAATAAIGCVLAVVVVISGFITINRNRDWQSNAVLFLKDVQTSTNSVIANTNAGMACIEHSNMLEDGPEKIAWLKKSIPYMDKAIEINNFYVVAHLNRGLVYVKLGDMEKAADDCDSVEKFFPTLPSAAYLSYFVSDYYDKKAITFANQNNQPEAIVNFKKAIAASPSNADLLYNLAYAYCKLNNYQEGRATLLKALQIKPDHAPSKQLLGQVNGFLGIK